MLMLLKSDGPWLSFCSSPGKAQEYDWTVQQNVAQAFFPDWQPTTEASFARSKRQAHSAKEAKVPQLHQGNHWQVKLQGGEITTDQDQGYLLTVQHANLQQARCNCFSGLCTQMIAG